MKKFIYTIGIALLATLAACSDSNKYDGITEGSDGMITISLGVDASQNSERLAFAGDAAKISVTFEEGDEIYLYKNSTLVTNNAGNPLVFKWVENDGSTGKFQLRMADSPATTTFLEETFGSGVFNAVLVGNNSDIATVPDDKFNSVVTAPSTSGTQTGTGDMAHLSIVAGVMKSYSEIGFVADGQIYKSDGTFHFDADYSIVKMTLKEPETYPGDEVIPTSIDPARVTFAMLNNDEEKCRFELKLDGTQSWESVLYFPIAINSSTAISKIVVVASNNTGDMFSQRSYFNIIKDPDLKIKSIDKQKVYSISPDLSGILYLKTLSDNPEIITYAPNRARLTLLDEYNDGEGADNTTDKTVSITRFSDIIITTMNARENPIALNFPNLSVFPKAANESSRGCFTGATKLYSVTGKSCTRIGINAFKESGIEYLDKELPELKVIEAAAFKGCKSLKTAIVPAITTLNNQVFMDCSSLEIAKFENVKSCNGETFKNCPNLTEVYLPNCSRIVSDVFSLSSVVATPELTITLGTEVPEGTKVDAGNNVFNYRINSKSGSSLGTTSKNDKAGPINLILGDVWAQGVIGNTSNPYSTFGIKVTATPVFGNSSNANDGIHDENTVGHYWWLGRTNSSNNFVYGYFNSITVIPSPPPSQP